MPRIQHQTTNRIVDVLLAIVDVNYVGLAVSHESSNAVCQFSQPHGGVPQ
jgi:hypothetical protein